MARNYNQEIVDSEERQYAYDFDNTLRDFMIRAFEPFLPQGKVLELGCYEGKVTEILTEKFSDVTVVEAASDCITLAQERVGDKANFVHSTFEEWETEEKYQAIFLVHTLEHLDDPIVVLKKINNWLADDGLLFLVVPNANAPSRQIAVKMGLITHNSAVTPAEAEHGHRCTYSLDTLERDARDGELDIIHRGGIFFKPFANFQFDKLMQTDIIDDAYLEGCYQLGMQYPDLCASIYVICGKGA